MVAYHTVATSMSATQSSQVKKKKTEWPEALKIYVGRAFENVEDRDRPKLEIFLKEMITAAFESNTVWTTNWEMEPLPDISDRILPTKQVLTENHLLPPPYLQIDSEHTNTSAKRKKSRFDVASTQGSTDIGNTEEQRAKRARRFDEVSRQTISPSVPPALSTLGYSEGVPDYDEHTIIGHATKLEKSYLRLTSAPDPGTVRPLHVLRETLAFLKRRWKEDANYAYICDQFKSLRQDLTVQRIKNDFTINVYEIHARIALEKSDLGEYNQCQTQLQNLYRLLPEVGHPLEFLAYRILYMLHTRNLTEINTVLVNLTQQQREDPNIAHALSVRKAMACSNYPRLFRLYLEAPNMSGYLMDNFINRERVFALAVICRSYRPHLLLDDQCAHTLGFIDRAELKDYLTGIDEEVLKDSINPVGDISDASKPSDPIQMLYLLDTKRVSDFFESKKQAMGGVDIKGQI